jgi:queuine tRNA-ribosyltransferase
MAKHDKYFTIKKKDKSSDARVGILKTSHGIAKTPYFMAVATQASGKCIGPDDYGVVADGIICNALILSLRPGTDIIRGFGTIHDFMDFQRPIFTDCGGFQMLRESFLDDRSSKGIHFKSPFDGKKFLLRPEDIMRIEKDIGADCIMMLDDVAPYDASKNDFERSLENTMNWGALSKKYHSRKGQMLYGIVQGGFFPELRKKSAEWVRTMDFDGNAIGGVAIGETREEMFTAIRNSVPYLDPAKPKHLLGVGSPDDIVEAVSLGLDTFDSVFPTQNARHGTLFTFNGKVDIMKGIYSNDKTPIENGCKCLACKNYSKAYIRHLLKIGEPTGRRYATIHNLYFMKEFMARIRSSIQDGKFGLFKRKIIKAYRKNKNVGVNVKQ